MKYAEPTCCLFHPSFFFVYSVTLKMEVIFSSETLVDFHWTTNLYVTEDKTLQPVCVCVFPHLRTETDPVSETLCFSLLFRKNPDNGQSPKTQYLCVLYTIVRTL
jgi:hypothetical protein